MSVLPVLSAAGINFSYNGKPVLRGVDLAVEPGEVVCLLGPNGCGKTTFMKCLGGLLKPASGRISLFGNDLAMMKDNQRARLSSFVFQEHPPVFAYSVLDVVLMGRGPYIRFFSSPSEEDRETAGGFLRELGIEDLSARSFSTLSGGEKQLVLIARALVQEPALLFLDEPTSFLDFGNQQKILDTINGLCRSAGRAVVMTTHEPDHAISVADRILLMKDGAILDSGKPLEVLGGVNMEKLYGVRTKLITIEDEGVTIHTVTPLKQGVRNGTRKEKNAGNSVPVL